MKFFIVFVLFALSISAQPVITLTGIVPPANGGTGVAGLTGVVVGNGSGFAVVPGNPLDCVRVNASSGACGTGVGSGIAVMTTGSVDPSGSCSAPSATNLSLYTQTTTQDIWTCVAADTWKKTLSTTNIGTYVVTGSTGPTPTSPATGKLTCYYDSSKVQNCVDDAGVVTSMVHKFSGTATLGTAAIASGACAAVMAVSAAGVLSTDVVTLGFNGDPTVVTGYVPTTAGMLTVIPYPTPDNINFKVCNNTMSPVTPGLVKLNWMVIR